MKKKISKRKVTKKPVKKKISKRKVTKKLFFRRNPPIITPEILFYRENGHWYWQHLYSTRDGEEKISELKQYDEDNTGFILLRSYLDSLLRSLNDLQSRRGKLEEYKALYASYGIPSYDFNGNDVKRIHNLIFNIRGK